MENILFTQVLKLGAIIDTKFFTFNQNNSGGYFIENDYVAMHLIIEAQNATEAIEKMKNITKDYSEYCRCCGERWSDDIDDDDGTNEPMVYDVKIREKEKDSPFGSSTTIYYYNGVKEMLWHQYYYE